MLDKRSALQAEQAAAQQALAAVQLNLPHLEAAKRAAAANKVGPSSVAAVVSCRCAHPLHTSTHVATSFFQDFKEAARLSGEIKLLSQQVRVGNSSWPLHQPSRVYTLAVVGCPLAWLVWRLLCNRHVTTFG